MSQDFQNQLQSILNSALNILQITATFIVAFLVVLWLTLCVWTFRDIQSRTRDVIAQVFATLLVIFFNIPGVLLYILVRPKETLAISYERSLQEEYMLQDLEEREICPTCRVKTQPDFMFCFNCRTRLRRECPNCASLIKLKWSSCPFCGTPQKSRPRDNVSDRAGLNAPRPPRQRPGPADTALVATDPNQGLSSYAAPNNIDYGAPMATQAPPQTYADGGEDYNQPDEQLYTYNEDNQYEAYQPKVDPARSTNGNGHGHTTGQINTRLADAGSQYEQPTRRYQSPRQRRNASDEQNDPDEQV